MKKIQRFSDDFARYRADFWVRLDRFFPERKIIFRTEAKVNYFHITKKPQIVAVCGLLVFASWLAFSSISYMLNDRIIASKDNQISNTRLAYQDLLDEVSKYQRKFSQITGDLEDNHSLMLDLVVQNTTLQQSLNSVATKLKVTEADRHDVIDTRERLKTDLYEIQDNLQAITGHNFLLQGNLDTIETDLATALAERNKALLDHQLVSTYVDELETRLSSLQTTQISTVEELTRRTDNNISNFERVIEIAGVSIDDLIENIYERNPELQGQGGPFIALSSAASEGLPAEDLKIRLSALDQRLEHLSALQNVMQHIPLTQPLNAYYVTSKFGKRQDPVNMKWSMHYGVDMGSTNKSPIYSTAPGTVSYAGWKGKYGNLVEIDHGDGFVTRFGHLSKVLVKKGEEIGFYNKLGLVGSTGRSTGPHLHYEVIFNGEPMNPMDFIKAGRYVFQE